jgi:hypothetical protein
MMMMIAMDMMVMMMMMVMMVMVVMFTMERQSQRAAAVRTYDGGRYGGRSRTPAEPYKKPLPPHGVDSTTIHTKSHRVCSVFLHCFHMASIRSASFIIFLGMISAASPWLAPPASCTGKTSWFIPQHQIPLLIPSSSPNNRFRV